MTLRRKLGYLSAREVASQLNTCVGWVTDHLTASHWYVGRNWYVEDDVAYLRTVIDTKVDANVKILDRRRAAGLYTIRDAAKTFGIVHITWQKSITHGRAPRPTHRFGNFLCYTEAEAQQIASQIKGRRRITGTFNRQEVCEQLGIDLATYARILKYHPTIGIKVHARLRWYRPEDIGVLRQHLEHEKKRANLYTVEEVYETLRLNEGQFRYRLRVSGLTLGQMIGGRRYYSDDDLKLAKRHLTRPKFARVK